MNSSRVHRIQSRIGVLGGTFDPIHNGHLAIADTVYNVLELTKVLFVPAGLPWIKAGRDIAPVECRVDMVRLAIELRPEWELSSVDVERGGPSYTVDTIADLRRRLGMAVELFLIVGADSLREMSRWHEPERLVSMCQIVCVGRPGEPTPDELPEGHPGRGAIYVSGPMLRISSTDIRERVRDGKSLEGLVPRAVAAYIEQHGLYRKETRTANA